MAYDTDTVGRARLAPGLDPSRTGPRRPHPSRRLRGDLVGRVGRRGRSRGGACRSGTRPARIVGRLRDAMAALHRHRCFGCGDHRRGAAAAAGAPDGDGRVPTPCAPRRPDSAGSTAVTCARRRGGHREAAGPRDGRRPGHPTARVSGTADGWRVAIGRRGRPAVAALRGGDRVRNRHRHGGDRRGHLLDGRRTATRRRGFSSAWPVCSRWECPPSRGSTCASCAPYWTSPSNLGEPSSALVVTVRFAV